MSRMFAVFALMFAFVFTASASPAVFDLGIADSCSVMADEKKDGKKGEEEAEPECD